MILERSPGDKKNVLTSLKWTIVNLNFGDSTINLSGTGNHVLDASRRGLAYQRERSDAFQIRTPGEK